MDVITVVWLGLFLAVVADRYGVTTVPPIVDGLLRLLFVVFVVDVVLRYRQSDAGPIEFLQVQWFYVLTVIPWFRPLRVIRAGRALRALRALSRSRRIGALVNKLRRGGKRLWPGREPD